MTSLAKTVVATGLSSGLGFEVLKQLLERTTPYNVVIGVRDTKTTDDAVEKLQYDRAANAVTVLPVDLSDLKGVKTFAQQALDSVGQGKIDYLLLNAGMFKGAEEKGRHGSKWCEAAVVNHFSQHYLIHLLREKLVASHSRIVVVSSGAICNVQDPTTIEEKIRGGSGTDGFPVYASTKFIQLLGAHWWRRQLKGQCDVVAVSPGLVPNTGLGRGAGLQLPVDSPDAKTIPQGASSILEALSRSDFPEDPDRIFLTSWGEWWEKDVIGKTVDRDLQDKWSPSKDELEKDMM
ncbi:hypothetical protein C2857_004234 [Epichloe festucae Fl1]|uniref:Uncharacterized protein n=1 Tax=Epichloe festucae (strain Fl1) TaxID=877507 RepID=A0A7S9PS61_EPIFF|nr:hypothetical protein C2857_004234 [Epichloe festucae Fl1]